jgi:hypothetical protein
MADPNRFADIALHHGQRNNRGQQAQEYSPLTQLEIKARSKATIVRYLVDLRNKSGIDDIGSIASHQVMS